MRVAVVDIGTNSTRLLIADVNDQRITELERRTTITRLGQGVDHTGELHPEAITRVYAALDTYKKLIDDNNVDATTGVLTSAVRDARNGATFTATVNERYAINARTITGDEEAQLTYLGATSDRTATDNKPRVVIDVGGGSTELVIGHGAAVDFHVSTQAGVVRQTERFLRSDPPRSEELQLLQAEAAEIFTSAVPATERARTRTGIAVAGTATSCAAILQELDPYDPARVHGFRLLRAQAEMLLSRLAAMTLAQRRHVTGLHPDRAPAIVAGIILLLEAMRTFDLTEVEVSEHDILRGAALSRGGGTGEG
ncbi:Ppx/GppA phosphatase family protein [Baekduia sp.]|jgi:exopolyphosphatase/guanosine-5'-triphosphate,3'-diphosphate pyrophosphatase|uniref:Ppx/GppA phosphatase family protein n=1 Tax=Baekduia sp. TaxID=2600305 RepID=UPI002E006C0F|nr:Ppx/GppA phosphatase family protein [Baekduia sp.]